MSLMKTKNFVEGKTFTIIHKCCNLKCYAQFTNSDKQIYLLDNNKKRVTYLAGCIELQQSDHKKSENVFFLEIQYNKE